MTNVTVLPGVVIEGALPPICVVCGGAASGNSHLKKIDRVTLERPAKIPLCARHFGFFFRAQLRYLWQGFWPLLISFGSFAFIGLSPTVGQIAALVGVPAGIILGIRNINRMDSWLAKQPARIGAVCGGSGYASGTVQVTGISFVNVSPEFAEACRLSGAASPQ